MVAAGMDRIGLIGVGTIGTMFLTRLLEANIPVTAYDIDQDRRTAAREAGAQVAETPEAVATKTERLLIAVPGSPEVEALLLENDALLESLPEDALVLNASTIRPETAISCSVACEEKAITYLEIPITGAAPREGYQIMAGGSEATYSSATPILDVISDDHDRIGAVGEAMKFKLALQLRYAGQNAIDAEVVQFLCDNEIDPAPMIDFLELDLWERYITRSFEQDVTGMGGLAIWHKDIGYALEAARNSNTAVPFTSILHEAYKSTIKQATGTETHAATLLRYWERLNNSHPSG